MLVGCVGAAPGHTLEPPTTITHKPPNSYMLNMGCTENVAAAAATARNGMNQKLCWIHNVCEFWNFTHTAEPKNMVEGTTPMLIYRPGGGFRLGLLVWAVFICFTMCFR